MRLYKTQTKYNCGIDLHSRCMYVCVMDDKGNKLIHQNIKENDFDYFLKIVEPYHHDLTVACESTFNWYWLCDACFEAKIEFVLGHALYMKAIHGGKTKNDKIDSEKIAHLLRTNMLPEAYAYPAEKRAIRTLLRQRNHYVWKRASLLANLSVGVMKEGNQPISTKIRGRGKRKEAILKCYENDYHKLSVEADSYMVEHFDKMIAKLESTIISHTKSNYHSDYTILQTIPGLGPILGLIILYEIDTIDRFPEVQKFSSYSRLIKCVAESSSKRLGTKGAKIGNAYLKYAITESALLCKRHTPTIQKYFQRLESKHGKKVANAILAHKIGRAIYFMLKRKQIFNISKFVKEKDKTMV